MIIGITDPMDGEETYARYDALLKRWIPNVETQILSCVTGDFSEIARCDAVVLSGGGDVHPKFYSRDEEAALAREIRVPRDLFEFDIIREALERNLPMMGICRGAQVFNVAMGGSLMLDIERAGYSSHRRSDGPDRTHEVLIEDGSILREIVGCSRGTINTMHHQAVDKVGRGLRASARAEDGIIEALEWADPTGKSYVMLVQWHPERFEDLSSPFARNLVERLAREVKGLRAA
ncbi:MAG TPA: gamma-glutamyl-gamma-aminobutyrate hydrolase family protein [Bacteroidota bacterium]|nr:gamma-glutamyl-gamma-aminobutyrate hydrolase family protein [Bacteroidota bacterium]